MYKHEYLPNIYIYTWIADKTKILIPSYQLVDSTIIEYTQSNSIDIIYNKKSQSSDKNQCSTYANENIIFFYELPLMIERILAIPKETRVINYEKIRETYSSYYYEINETYATTGLFPPLFFKSFIVPHPYSMLYKKSKNIEGVIFNEILHIDNTFMILSFDSNRIAKFIFALYNNPIPEFKTYFCSSSCPYLVSSTLFVSHGSYISIPSISYFNKINIPIPILDVTYFTLDLYLGQKIFNDSCESHVLSSLIFDTMIGISILFANNLSLVGINENNILVTKKSFIEHGMLFNYKCMRTKQKHIKSISDLFSENTCFSDNNILIVMQIGREKSHMFDKMLFENILKNKDLYLMSEDSIEDILNWESHIFPKTTWESCFDLFRYLIEVKISTT